jgi:hypothetical protein
MSRGRFDRNEIQDRNGNWLYIEKEEKIKKGGSIFLAVKQYGFDHGSYSIYWRKTRNVTRYGWNGSMDCIREEIADKNEAEAYFAKALKTFDPGPNATKRRKRREKRDSQRKRVYAWETSVVNKHPLNECMTKSEVSELYHRVFEHYGISKANRPILKFRSCHGASTFHHGWSVGVKEKIKYSVGGRKRRIVLHEIAHCLSFREHGSYNAIAGHGAEFVGWYMELLIEFGEQDMNFLRKSLRDFEYKTRKRTMRGVKYASPNTNAFSQKEAA